MTCEGLPKGNYHVPTIAKLQVVVSIEAGGHRLHDKAIADYSDAIRLNPADTTAIEHRKRVYAEQQMQGVVPPNGLADKSAIITNLSR